MAAIEAAAGVVREFGPVLGRQRVLGVEHVDPRLLACGLQACRGGVLSRPERPARDAGVEHRVGVEAEPARVLGELGVEQGRRQPAREQRGAQHAVLGAGGRDEERQGEQERRGQPDAKPGRDDSAEALGIKAGKLFGPAAMSIVSLERSGMASGINGTMRQVGVALGFAGLGAILAAATEAAFAPAAATLHLAAGDVSALAGFVIKGDLAGGAARLPDALHSAFIEAAHTALFHGFRTIAAVAGLVGLGGAAATFALLRGAGAPAASATPTPAIAH